MDLLPRAKEQHPEMFREQEKTKWQEPEGDYGFLIRLVMRWSGGRIQDIRQANYVLLGGAVVIAIISVIIFTATGGGPTMPSERELLRDTPISGVRQGAEIPQP